ncbi:putative quercetin 2,3-dioxygenase [Cyphellophora attinorum]|uniref:Putative quercetin 2,3-dioxygenase n=1 Tax=Cyphellophora attinorum TaxID=1664694 RepID=A0A0N1HAD1_9EURO|nr:putative quercetin 2,3-dioxygenase [Phialophora attinorum]KPI39533.1 putative quercetin 2,3-dioxygenase [Phialophora attinorum]
MSLPQAKIVPRRSAERGAADHGWLDTKHTFSFASYYNPKHEQFGALRVLNEDRVAPGTGFPTHPHRDAEIFSYILSGELTHRDSMQKQGKESNDSKTFYRMHRGDVQFTTGGKGIAHSEQNEHNKDWVHFLQIWAMPWKKGLPPNYHTTTFGEEQKRKAFVPIITPLKAGPKASLEDEKAAIPVKDGTIPVHADLVFSAGIIPAGSTFEYKIGGDDYVSSKLDRKTYVHFPATKGGKAKIRLAGETVLSEGDGAYVTKVNSGDVLTVESIGEAEAEVVVIDSN